MELTVQIVSILFMITLIVISILVCITGKLAYTQLKYQNYLLEKLTHNINLLVSKDLLVNPKDITNLNISNSSPSPSLDEDEEKADG